MGLENVKYDAFISYRHGGLDQEVAEKLQKKLELFKVPKNLLTKANRPKINRIFRDQSELPLVANLSEPIEMALHNADTLILICSPRLLESMWCDKEVETFKKLHGVEHIIAVLIDGEPKDSFPKRICEREIEVMDKDGNMIKTTVEIEPLAADIRATNKKEYNKKLNDAVIRIAAAICGLNYDDLKQRHREQAIKRRATFFGIVAAISLVIAVASVSMLLEIKSQSDTIELQNGQIEKQLNELSVQYEQAQLRQANHMASAANELYARGRKKDALYALMSVLPATEEGEENKPYSNEAHKALADVLEVYRINPCYKPEYIIEQINDEKSIITSANDKYLAVVGNEKTVTIYDNQSGENIYETKENTTYSILTDFSFVGDEYFIYATGNSVFALSLDTLENIEIMGDSESNLSKRSIKVLDSYVCLYNGDMVTFYDRVTLEKIGDYSKTLGIAMSFKEFFQYGDEIYVIVASFGQEEVYVYNLSLEDGSLSELCKFNGFFYGNCYLLNDKIIFFDVNKQEFVYKDMRSIVTCYSITEKRVLWTTEIEGDNNYCHYLDEMDALFTIGLKDIYIIDGKDGSKIIHERRNSIIRTANRFMGKYIVTYDEDNKITLWNEYGELEETSLEMLANKPVEECAWAYVSNSNLYIRYKNSNYLAVYKYGSDIIKNIDSKDVNISDVEDESVGLFSRDLETKNTIDCSDGNTFVVDKEAGKYSLLNSEGQIIYSNELNCEDVYNYVVSVRCNLVLVFKITGELEFYDYLTGEYKGNLRNLEYAILHIYYLENMNTYVLSDNVKCYLVNKNLEYFTGMDNLKGYYSPDNSLILFFASSYYEVPYYSYEELVNMARAQLGDYEASPSIKEKYSIE